MARHCLSGRFSIFFGALALYSLCSGSMHGISSNGPLYTGIYGTNAIYSVDRQTGSTTQIAICPGPVGGYTDIAQLNSTTAYALNGGEGNIYSINLQTGAGQRVTSTPLPVVDLFAITVADSSTAYVVDYTSQDIYSVNLLTGTHALLTTLPGTPGPTDIVVGNNSTAYVTGYNDNNVYAVNLQTGAAKIVTSSPIGSPGIQGITLANNTTAYVSCAYGGKVYMADLTTGVSVPVSFISGGPALTSMAIDNTTAYTVNNIAGQIYAINVNNGSYVILANISAADTSGLVGAALLLQMGAPGLSGNDRKVADYLNANAPLPTVRLLALLTDAELPPALMSVAPTRNALLTYASQNALLAASQALADHGHQKRFHRQSQTPNPVALLADAAGRLPQTLCPQQPYTVWLAPFGEYAREKEQHQTPAFSMGLGGAIGAFEWTGLKNNVVGCAAAYVYTHVHEETGAGQANLNQGFFTTYATLSANKWYFDLGAWGGYYHCNNQRSISFPGVDNTAQSHTHGWQAAPHFEVGYDNLWMKQGDINWFGIEPFLMADWVANWEKGFQESGTSNFNMGQKGRFCSLLRGESGLRFHEIIRFDCGKLILREKGSYAYQKAFNTGKLTAFLLGSPGTFTVETLTTAQNLGVFEFSMLFVSNNTKAPSVDLRYQGEFGSRYQSHQGMIEIAQSF